LFARKPRQGGKVKKKPEIQEQATAPVLWRLFEKPAKRGKKYFRFFFTF
jgi:hypothetical protein